MKWLIGVVVIAALAFFGYQYMQKNAALDAENAAIEAQNAADAAAKETEEATKAALESAQEAMPDGVDLTKISGALDGVFESTTSALSGITDVDSAKAAIPSLEEASDKLGGLSDVVTRLPDAAKGPVGSIVSSGLETLQPMIDKVSELPGVGDLLEPIITPMLETLNGLGG